MTQRIDLSHEELKGLTIEGARNLVVRCFFEAQKETFGRAASKLGSAPSDDQLRSIVEGAVRLAFRATHGDFNHPTRDGLVLAVERLAAQAAAMGTPTDIIEHHRSQLGRVFAAIS